MWRFARRVIACEKGNIVATMIFGGIVLGAALVVAATNAWRSSFSNEKLKDNLAQVMASSAVESALLAYRFNEIKYIQSVKNCEDARPFLSALVSGSGCDLAMEVDLFAGSDPGSDDRLYSYASAGCRVSRNSSTCKNPGNKLLLTIGHGQGSDPINEIRYKIYAIAFSPEKQVAQFLLEAELPPTSNGIASNVEGKTFKNRFAIRSSAPNFAHLELADGRVVQEKVDPLSRCPGEEWNNLLLFSPVKKLCEMFSLLGSGTGLSFYDGSYFGFRPFDQTIVNLSVLSGATGGSVFVPESGLDGANPVFPRYDSDLLMNVDDITISEDEIQMVKGTGLDAEIGVLARRGAGLEYRSVCPLGALGWAQGYSGIAALPWSSALGALPSDATEVKLAYFFLKTDGGNLLTALVQATTTGYECSVFKDAAIQQIEFLRTGGFDRAVDVARYYLY